MPALHVDQDLQLLGVLRDGEVVAEAPDGRLGLLLGARRAGERADEEVGGVVAGGALVSLAATTTTTITTT